MSAVTDAERELFERAKAASSFAYVPYCDFTVGAALQFEDGTIVTGANVDNASSPLTACAERGACSTGIALGLRSIEKIAVFGPAASVSPCGGCRQVLSEFTSRNATVTFPWEGELITVPFTDLLPFPFRLGAAA